MTLADNYFWIIYVLSRKKRPEFFVIENVKGILDDKHKAALDNFINSLKAPGYNVTHMNF